MGVIGKTLLATLASWSLLNTSSLGMNFSYSISGNNKDEIVIHMAGEILPGDAVRFFSFIKAIPALPIALFDLDSPGGIINEAGVIGDSIRSSQMGTAVVHGHKCTSACFMLFAAGVHRYVTPDVFIGVHGAANSETGTETLTSYAMDVAMARTLRVWGLPTDIVGRMVTTRNNEIYQLDIGDLRSMGVVILADPPVPAPDSSLTPPANLSAMYQRGLTDRTFWERWFESLPMGDYRSGAEYGHRNGRYLSPVHAIPAQQISPPGALRPRDG